jgi:uncharacterized secreted protein with C-terminal beta-propeller domain
MLAIDLVRSFGGIAMKLMRAILGVLVLLATASSLAASVAERSPFAQGLWWDPTKSGHGFQIFNSTSQAAVVWYTYDPNGQPTWYTAQGELSSVGNPWPLMKQRWANGRLAEPAQVGTLRLNVRQPEAADLAWTIGATSGTWAIQPFTVSGVINEVDHTGMWFDPSNSGWGFSLLEQGNVLGGILYGYDVSGAPTWAAGFDRTPGSVQIHAYTGPCPSCSYRAPTTRSVGRLDFNFRGEADLTFRSNFSAEMAVGTNIDGANAIQLTRYASWRAADRQLASFDTEARLKAYLDAGMLTVPPYSSGTDFSASPSQPAYSPTNLQESGVDEADLVKTDGRFIYTFGATESGSRRPAIRVAELTNNGTVFRLRGEVALASGATTPMGNAGLYLDGENLVSVTGSQGGSWWGVGGWSRGVTRIEVMNTATVLPTTRWRAEIDGYPVASRRIGNRLYVISRFVPYLTGFVFGTSYAPSVAANQAILAATPLSGLLPSVRINGGGGSPAVGASEVYVPPQGSRPATADMILVTAIDLAGGPRIAQTLAIIGTADAAYASTESLFVAGSRYPLRNGFGSLLPESYFTLTDVHQIRLGANVMTIVGSASLEGFLGSDPEQASFRLSDYQGRLRAVTSTTSCMWTCETKNRLTVLEQSTVAPGLLKTVAYLPNAQRPDTLGKRGELLYSTRFLGDRLYAVTFKKIDPLYVVDLSAAADPKIAGAVELPGFSNYLHPLPDGLLLGFGKDAVPADSTGDAQFAWYQGLQLTLFDVSNASQPRELQRVLFGKRGSDSALLRDHHALSILPQPDGSMSIAFPARLHDGAPEYGYTFGPSTTYSYQQSGLMRIELLGSGRSRWLAQTRPNLITGTAANPGGPSYYSGDPTYNGRAILTGDGGAVFVGNGQFWLQDGQGKSYGPF